MKTQVPGLQLSILAAAALTRGTFIMADGNPAGANKKAIGVCALDTASGEYAPVGIHGVYLVKSGAAITVTDEPVAVMTDSSARAIPTTGQNQNIVGYALDSASGANEYIRVIVTHATANLFDQVTASAAEINLVDGSVAGTAIASKALALDANKCVDELSITTLKLGASGSSVAVGATAAELNLLDLSAQSETITAAGAVSVTKRVTNLEAAAGGDYAVTLAAPDATMVGQVKVIQMTVRPANAVTMALTNVVGGSQAASASFDAVGETLILVAGASKWIVVKEHGVTLS